jgi:ABC-type phosphate transport system permease subunit
MTRIYRESSVNVGYNLEAQTFESVPSIVVCVFIIGFVTKLANYQLLIALHLFS